MNIFLFQVGSNHPILQTAKNVLYAEQNHLQPWGLVILLLSKAVSSPNHTLQSNTIAENQRVLAELTEMIRTGNLIHKGLVNIPIQERFQCKDNEMFGNKIAILIGDYLLVTANGMLAHLRNQDLSYVISTALRDLSDGEFYGNRDEQNMPLPSAPSTDTTETDSFEITCDTLPINTLNSQGYPIREWTARGMFNGASLLGRGCQGAMILAQQPMSTQETAYCFGCHICLAWQAASELQKFTSNSKEPFSLVSAPVLFALNDNVMLHDKIKNVKVISEEVDFEELKMDILKTDAVERTKMLYREHVRQAENLIQSFGDKESVLTMKKLINIL